MAHEFKRIHRVEFAETDMAGIVHFANFFRLMEVTEHEFLRSLGLSVHPPETDVSTGWPRVRAVCDYRSPLRFEEEVEIHLRVREMKTRSIAYEFTFRKADGEKAAEGTLTVVYVTRDTLTGKMKACPIPEEFVAKITVAPAD